MSYVLKTVEDGVMKIVLNRPDAMNALNRDMMSGFSDALEEAAGDRRIFASACRSPSCCTKWASLQSLW